MNQNLIIMKKYVLFTITAIASLGLQAQEFYGVATYESKTTFDMSATSDGNEMPELEIGLQEQLAKAFEKTFTLHFDKTASLYEEQEKLSQPSPGSGGAMLEINVAGEGRRYKNLKEKTYRQEAEEFDKNFLIADKLPEYDWKMTGETKKIGNYNCYKATAVIKPKLPEPAAPTEVKTVNILGDNNKEVVITAWYTPDVPVSHGPSNYWGLPGLILEVSDGHTALLCSKLVINPKEKKPIKEPKKGQKVTQAEFDKIMEEKTAEMMEMYNSEGSGGGNVIIKIGG